MRFSDLVRFQDREEWLRARKRFIGSSDIVSIVGKGCIRGGYFSDAQHVWADKLNLVPAWGGNEATFWGSTLEPVVFEHTARLLREQELVSDDVDIIYTPMASARPSRDVGVPIACTADGLLAVGGELVVGGVEIKCTAQSQKAKWENGPPVHVELQCQWHMLCADVEVWFVGCLIGGNRYSGPWVIERNVTCQEFLLDCGRTFWRDYVETSTEPPEWIGGACAHILEVWT